MSSPLAASRVPGADDEAGFGLEEDFLFRGDFPLAVAAAGVEETDTGGGATEAVAVVTGETLVGTAADILEWGGA